MAAYCCGFLVLCMVLSRPVTCDFVLNSVWKDVSQCSGDSLELCLNYLAIDALLDASNLTDVKNASKAPNGRSNQEAIETRLFEMISTVSGVSEDTINAVWTGRSRTFRKPWKYLVPLLIGVILNLGTFIPLMLTVLLIIAKNALISSNLAVLLTGLNIALKYWHWGPKAPEYHHPPPSYHDHFGQPDYEHLHTYSQGFGHGYPSFPQQSHQTHEDYQDLVGSYGHQGGMGLPYTKTRRVSVDQ